MGLSRWTRVVLAGGWTSLMLVFLLGDVLRLFAGNTPPGVIDGQRAEDWMWTAAAGLMLVPIAMVGASLLVPTRPLRWLTTLACAGLSGLNLAGLPYVDTFDNVLIALSVAMTGGLVWAVWRQVPQPR